MSICFNLAHPTTRMPADLALSDSYSEISS